MANRFISKDECSHSGAHKETICGQRTGEYVCDECGSSWQSSESLEFAQEIFRTQQAEKKTESDEFTKLSMLNPVNLADKIEQLARDQITSLVDDDPVAGLIANTKATGWGIDTLEVDQSSIEASKEGIVCTANVQFTGDQDEDSGPAGTIINGTVTVRILPDLTVKIEDEEFEIDNSSYDDDSYLE